MGMTRYSDKVAGDRGNFNWSARYDWTSGEGGYLGITQMEGGAVKDRVLLSPQQINELLAFIEASRRVKDKAA